MTRELTQPEKKDALLFTGIETQADMVEHLQTLFSRVKSLSFQDHHSFTVKDLEDLAQDSADYFITTEKDAQRLYAMEDVPASLKERLYILPIEITILDEREEQLKKYLLDYVKKNTTNNRISQAKIAHHS